MNQNLSATTKVATFVPAPQVEAPIDLTSTETVVATKGNDLPSGAPRIIWRSQLVVVQGSNPRRKLEDIESLASSIRAHGGLLQTVLTRPYGQDQFQLAAGYRRVAALDLVHGWGPDGGTDYQLPTLVKEMDDRAYAAAALSENTERQDMTVIDEAEAAADVLSRCGGDKKLAAEVLGYPSVDTLSKRLALTHASELVRKALREEKIEIGHAALLAGLSQVVQDQFLQRLIKEPISVKDLKGYIHAKAFPLDAVLFDTQECVGCPHNSKQQQMLFGAEQAVEGARCTNPPCHKQKTAQAKETMQQVLTTEWAVVRFFGPGEAGGHDVLRADGPQGVGETQAEACKGCSFYGIAISEVPGSVGKKSPGVCFDLACRARNIAKRKAAASASKEPPQDKAIVKAAARSPDPAKEGAGTTAKPASDTQPKHPVSKVEVVEVKVSGPFTEHREQVWRAVLREAIRKLDGKTSMAVLISVLVHRPSHISSHQLDDALKAAGVDTGSGFGIAGKLSACLDLESAHLKAALGELPAHWGGDAPISDVVAMLKGLDIKLADHWKLNADTLALLQKTGLQAIAKELGIRDAMGEEAFLKAAAGKKDDFIKSILSVKGFNYVGKVPQIMRW